MIKTNEAALICDLAETYHIFDYRSLPLKKVATFAVGLKEDSRIKMAMSKIKYSFDTLLIAAILDNLNQRTWAMSEDARNGGNRPQHILNRLLGEEYQEQDQTEMGFESGEEYERARRKILG